MDNNSSRSWSLLLCCLHGVGTSSLQVQVKTIQARVGGTSMLFASKRRTDKTIIETYINTDILQLCETVFRIPFLFEATELHIIDTKFSGCRAREIRMIAVQSVTVAF